MLSPVLRNIWDLKNQATVNLGMPEIFMTTIIQFKDTRFS